jgi:adenosylcobinamide-phosphate synthase
MDGIWLAFLLDGVLGDPDWFPHPVRIIGRYISLFERRVRELQPGKRGLRTAGAVLTVSTVAFAYGAVWGVLFCCKQVNPWLFSIVNVLIMWTCIAPRCLCEEALRIFKLLAQSDLTRAREQLSLIVGRDTANLAEDGIVRGVIETVAENTSDGVIAPLFYLFLGGAPLAMAYKAVNTLDSMVGYKKDFYADFGWSAARLDDLANFIPARLTAGLLLLSTLPLRLDFENCLRILRRDRNNHASPNSGYPEAAVAGALRIRLGGPSSYFGKIVVKPFIGDADTGLNRNQIVTTTRMMYTAAVLALGFFSVIFPGLRGWL